jgi:hypothetical protein
MILVRPSHEYLTSCIDALHRGWLPAAQTHDWLRLIDESPDAFLSSFEDPQALAHPLPGIGRWMTTSPRSA